MNFKKTLKQIDRQIESNFDQVDKFARQGRKSAKQRATLEKETDQLVLKGALIENHLQQAELLKRFLKGGHSV